MDQSKFQQHYSHQYNAELEQIRTSVLNMGGLVEQQLEQALAALSSGTPEQGEQVVANDYIGEVAGAGVAGHVHLHVVPRWAGDTNFFTTVGNVRCIPQGMQESYELLRAAWSEGAESHPALGGTDQEPES